MASRYDSPAVGTAVVLPVDGAVEVRASVIWVPFTSVARSSSRSPSSGRQPCLALHQACVHELSYWPEPSHTPAPCHASHRRGREPSAARLHRWLSGMWRARGGVTDSSSSSTPMALAPGRSRSCTLRSSHRYRMRCDQVVQLRAHAHAQSVHNTRGAAFPAERRCHRSQASAAAARIRR
jgi:hypothetical protein